MNGESGRLPTRVAVVGPWHMSTASVEGQSLNAMWAHRHAIRRRLGVQILRVRATSLDEIEATLRDPAFDVAIVCVPWRESPVMVEGVFRSISSVGAPRIVFLDTYDQTSSPFFGVLPYVACYAKRQLLRDRSAYTREMEGGYIFTDYLVRILGYDIGDWHFGSLASAEHLSRLCLSWNLGVRPGMQRRLWWQSKIGKRWSRRKIDLFGRIGVTSSGGERGWKGKYRAFAVDAFGKVPGRHSDAARISRRAYGRELRDAKIVFSPFGWGEICWRDFEAITAGALLVKPSVAHLDTEPNVFREGETYVPVRWDLADLSEVCVHYLEHPDDAERIVRNAQRALCDYASGGGVVAGVQRILEKANRPS